MVPIRRMMLSRYNFLAIILTWLEVLEASMLFHLDVLNFNRTGLMAMPCSNIYAEILIKFDIQTEEINGS